MGCFVVASSWRIEYSAALVRVSLREMDCCREMRRACKSMMERGRFVCAAWLSS